MLGLYIDSHVIHLVSLKLCHIGIASVCSHVCAFIRLYVHVHVCTYVCVPVGGEVSRHLSFVLQLPLSLLNGFQKSSIFDSLTHVHCFCLDIFHFTIAIIPVF